MNFTKLLAIKFQYDYMSSPETTIMKLVWEGMPIDLFICILLKYSYTYMCACYEPEDYLHGIVTKDVNISGSNLKYFRVIVKKTSYEVDKNFCQRFFLLRQMIGVQTEHLNHIL